MKLEWMGRYRDIIGKIMRNGNVYARIYTDTMFHDVGISLCPLEWQTLECILEYEDEQCNMTVLANKMGIPQSNFSKYVKTLRKYELVERYKKENNNKDIILRASNLGRTYYEQHSKALEMVWQDVFPILKDFSEEQLDTFSLFVEKLTESFSPNSNLSELIRKD